ncbi:hypothetical protein [Amycolatopsis sp. FDAARGOS 1241]|uniref:hypothetical protein n=1 Tax=Amycolatopsis sp. FDAARGOS 1241 TaxID=2778070 RepID=UPI00194FFC29|nr:hypothetical protein [Amycolatopsis sp. FDAARGOS 1241]QRP45026.1 hypothetical protein I6J71_38490 [Amycolatopsis sp. FDAARGOS 1241]
MPSRAMACSVSWLRLGALPGSIGRGSTAAGSITAAADRYLQAVLGWSTDALSGWPEEGRATFGPLLDRFVEDLTARHADLDDS